MREKKKITYRVKIFACKTVCFTKQKSTELKLRKDVLIEMLSVFVFYSIGPYFAQKTTPAFIFLFSFFAGFLMKYVRGFN